jgi:hypothetical protein
MKKSDRILGDLAYSLARPPLELDVESAKVVDILGVGSGFSFMVG